MNKLLAYITTVKPYKDFLKNKSSMEACFNYYKRP